MKVTVSAVLYKRVTNINWRALSAEERGQYDLRLGTDAAFESFFDGVPATEPTAQGGWTRHVTFAAVGGDDPVPPHNLRFRFMGADSQRKDFYFASQNHRGAESYPLWHPARAEPNATSFTDVEGAVVVVIRDVHGAFHARWVRADEVDALPRGLRGAIRGNEKGVFMADVEGGAISPRAQEVLDALKQHHNVLLYGPPGTGKTFVVQEVMNAFSVLTIDTEKEHGAIEGGTSTRALWTTFHQSYSYEDFIVGLRPRPDPGGNGFALEPVPGTLLELSEWARQPGRQGLLVIDEINRGNVSRIFGELITLLEVDKRLGPDGQQMSTTVPVRLPYVAPGQDVEVELSPGERVKVPTPFTLPRDIFVLATMNSVDTSVAPLDAALRRRFRIVNLVPDFDIIRGHLGLPTGNDLPIPGPALATRVEAAALAVRLMERLNEGIGMFLGNDFQLGQWYLQPLVGASDNEAAAVLSELWTGSLLPQLLEYFAGRSEQLLSVLRHPSGFHALSVEVPSPEDEALGASVVVSPAVNPPTADVTDLLRHVANVVASDDESEPSPA